jgi:hypothetical protein
VLGTRSNEVGTVEGGGLVPIEPVEALGSETVMFQFAEALNPQEIFVKATKIDPSAIETIFGDKVVYSQGDYQGGNYLPSGNPSEYNLTLPPGEYVVAFSASISQSPDRSADWCFHVKVVEDPS